MPRLPEDRYSDAPPGFPDEQEEAHRAQMDRGITSTVALEILRAGARAGRYEAGASPADACLAHAEAHLIARLTELYLDLTAPPSAAAEEE